MWCFKEKGSNTFRNLDQSKDVKYEVDEYFVLDEDLSKSIDELILSDSTNRVETIITNVKNLYPVFL